MEETPLSNESPERSLSSFEKLEDPNNNLKYGMRGVQYLSGSLIFIADYEDYIFLYREKPFRPCVKYNSWVNNAKYTFLWKKFNALFVGLDNGFILTFKITKDLKLKLIHKMKAQDGRVRSMQVIDGKNLVITAGNQSIRFFNSKSLRPLDKIETSEPIFSADIIYIKKHNLIAVSAESGNINLFDLDSKKLALKISNLQYNSRYLFSLTYSEIYDTLYSVMSNGELVQCKVNNEKVLSKNEIKLPVKKGFPWKIELIRNDSCILATFGNENIYLYEIKMKSWRLIPTDLKKAYGFVLNHNKKFLLLSSFEGNFEKIPISQLEQNLTLYRKA